MIKELCDYGERLRKNKANEGQLVHNAIKDEPLGFDLLINADGSFDSFLSVDITTKAESLTSKKGKARLLVDKAEEVLAFINEASIKKAEEEGFKKGKKKEEARADYIKGVQSKHNLFSEKLELYSSLEILKPVFLFYENKTNGIDKAQSEFAKQDAKLQAKNICFRLADGNERLNEKSEVIGAVIAHYDGEQQSWLSEKKCSICGKTEFPVIDEPHGMIKRVPSGQQAGTALVSYNAKAFESYNMSGNENSSICTNCARNYVDGLNELLTAGYEKIVEDKKSERQNLFDDETRNKKKTIWVYKNRRDFHTKDTAVIYWTRENSDLNEIDLLETPDDEQIGKLFDSVAVGKEVKIKDTDMFYSCTLSGSAARIAIRDWIEVSLPEYRQNITNWFKDIEITAFDFFEKHRKIYHPSVGALANTVKSKKSTADTLKSRIIPYLWTAAIKNAILPLWILQTVLKQTHYIEHEENGEKSLAKEPITKERAALIRLVLNRNNSGGFMGKELDDANLTPAYVCGQIFSVIVDIQRAAMGSELNADIRSRFFSFASTTPAAAFGRLMKLSQNHLSKLKIGNKSYLYGFFDKKLQEVCAKLDGEKFPAMLTLEEQGQFALGYYHKKQETLTLAQKNADLKKALVNKEEEDGDKE
ncbi:CRISPR-associated Csd1 family protein [Spirochaetia bacterium]|nr:CRISPR-associated Csd1 family protein [Spirochaetia bacterium]